jgi:hypothetical protein
MPIIKIELFGDRRPITDLVTYFHLEGNRVGTLREESDLKPGSRRFTVNAAPDQYRLLLEINGFRPCRKRFTIRPDSGPAVRINLAHRCLHLPEYDQLSLPQQTLLATLDGAREDQWRALSDNQCATFFQITHALTTTMLANGRPLSSYLERIRRIGGVEIEDDLPQLNGSLKTATGWRLHAIIRRQDRPRIASDLVEEDMFGGEEGSVHSTHARFGLIRSHREKGPLPRLQIVFDANYEHADLDLDVEFHKSSPHDVFRHFIRKYPEVRDIYKY